MLAAFEAWRVEHGTELAIPLIAEARRCGSIRLAFAGLVDAIKVVVVQDEIMIVVNHRDQCWDTLASFDCAPIATSNGFVCDICDPADRVIYSTHEGLYRGHVFGPLAAWIESTLVPAHALGLGGDIGGATWATLFSADDNRGYWTVIPLRRSPCDGSARDAD